MENEIKQNRETEIRNTIAQNLTELRKTNKLKQTDVGDRLGYSSKTVSKWENGDSTPDITLLCEISEFYGITVNDLLEKDACKKVDAEAINSEKINRHRHIFSMFLYLSVLLMTATMTFVFFYIQKKIFFWEAFVWFVPVSAWTLQFVEKRHCSKDGIKVNKVLITVFFSIFWWSLLIAVFLQIKQYSMWPIFIMGVPIQAILLLNHNFKRLGK